MKMLACRDAGINCDFVAHGKTNEEVFSKITEHGKKVHAMKESEFTPDKIKKLRSLIHEEKPQARP